MSGAIKGRKQTRLEQRMGREHSHEATDGKNVTGEERST
jgi:hypothetical protein